MSVVAPKLFQSADTGAPTLSGTAGDLVEVLSSCLVIRKMFTAVSNASYVDNTTDARLTGGAGFALFQGPAATTNEAYFGSAQKFERIKLAFGTAGVQGSAVTLVWEYWNGSAWTALTVTDSTSGLTANGVVTFSMPSDWATTARNSVTLYWVRLRYTAGSWSTNPLCNFASLAGWSEEFTATSARAYRMGAANQFYLNVNDNAPGAGAAREARVLGYETMSAVGTGTNPFPLAATYANGLFVRKSTTADATTRSWILVCDDRTLYFYCIPADAGNIYTGLMFGDFYSLIPSDPYRTMISARTSENQANTEYGSVVHDGATRNDFQMLSSATSNTWMGPVIGSSSAGSQSMKFFARNIFGTVGAAHAGWGAIPMANCPTGSASVIPTGQCAFAAQMVFPNSTDGGVFAMPVWVWENTTPASAVVDRYRGRLRGFLGFQHAAAAVNDRQQFSGSGALAGKTIIVLKPTQRSSNDVSTPAGTITLEISDTWETNV